MRLKLLSFVLASGLAFASCKKDETTDQIGNKDINEISAPANFNWSGSRDVSLSIGITDGNFGNQIHVIKIYSADPAKGGELISSGSATQILPFNTKFALSSMIKEVFVVKVAPSGASVQQTLALTSDNVSANISATGVTSIASVGRVSANRAVSVVSETSPNCTTGCNVTPAPSSTSFDISGTNVYCLTQSGTYKIQNVNGSPTIRVCATGVTIEDLKLTGGATLIVTTTGSVNLNNFGFNGVGHIKNFGTITTSNSNVQFNSGGSFYNSGNFTTGGDFYATNGTVVTNTGTMTVNGNTTTAAATFDNTGNLTLKGSKQFQGSGSSLTNTGTVVFDGSGNTTFEGAITNSGTFTFNGGEINVNSGSPVINNTGIFTATSSKLNHSTGTFTNGGSVTIKELNQNSNGKIVNNCKWLVTENASSISAPIDNYSYFRVTGSINVNSGGVITLFNGAMFRAGSIQALNTPAIGSGANKSVFKVDGNIDGNLINNARNDNSGAQARFSGNLQLDLNTSTYSLTATQPGQNQNDLPYVSGLPVGFFINGAQRLTSSNAAYIPTSTCMPEGSGTAPVNNDRDGDGVINSEDAYPDDATKAFISYSENYLAGGSTIAFEDSWPLKGDYDLNDVVINYKYKVITNAQNKVVRVEADYKLLATGGEFQNGAGIEFPIAAAKATGFSGPTGTSLESGQEKAVVILFQNSRAEQATWNTQTGQTASPAKDYAIAFNVVDGPNISDFGISTFNPFIWNGSAGFGRGYETHLYGKKPTTKANISLFGTGNDATNQTTRYYGTSNNLPWAITLPIATFKYPLERVPITEGYLQFSNWATNGGGQSQDWFSNTAPAYRNASKLYGSN